MNLSKKNKILLKTLLKEFFNSVYGVCIRKDIEEVYKCGTPRWIKIEYDDSVKESFSLQNGSIAVKIKDRDCVDEGGVSKKLNSKPSRLGSFLLSHSKRLMNDVMLSLDGCENNNLY